MDFGSPDTWRWIWLAAAVVFAVGEIAVAGSFFLLPFAGGAVAAAVVAFARRVGGPVRGWPSCWSPPPAPRSCGPSPAASTATRPQLSTGANRWVGRQATVLQRHPRRAPATPASSASTGRSGGPRA